MVGVSVGKKLVKRVYVHSLTSPILLTGRATRQIPIVINNHSCKDCPSRIMPPIRDSGGSIHLQVLWTSSRRIMILRAQSRDNNCNRATNVGAGCPVKRQEGRYHWAAPLALTPLRLAFLPKDILCWVKTARKRRGRSLSFFSRHDVRS